MQERGSHRLRDEPAASIQERGRRIRPFDDERRMGGAYHDNARLLGRRHKGAA
ncbi:unannotated protein [freshwater metagenome]|uniref:Unannotated protein n=1 Tax=freshwater metagenome TaxID=449393 RepID=A0A6J6VR67_9ZZZZ